MRYLAIHADYFRCEVTKKGRSPVIESYKDPVTEAEDAVVLLISVEKTDEGNEERVALKSSDLISEHCNNLKVTKVIIHPFAHLFAELSKPDVAIKTLKILEAELDKRGFTTIRTPFGWFNTLELKAKGHPFSRVSRVITSQ